MSTPDPNEFAVPTAGRKPGEVDAAAPARIRVGVSSCLLGHPVRYDSGHKHDRNVTDILGLHFDLVALCPEVEVGMGIPREAVRLVRQAGTDDPIRMQGIHSGTDHTDSMREYARRRVAEIDALGICGYILKKGSPSCGKEQVPTYTTEGMAAPAGRGLFAAVLVATLPSLPLEEEGRLADAALREKFIERVFAYARVRGMLPSR